MLSIQGANRTNCCSKKESDGSKNNKIVRDICGRPTKCCISNCETPTAISYGYDNVEEDNKNLAPTVSSDNAFYIETSGVRSLSVRQACAVESFARLNPSLTVYVFMTPSNGSKIDIKATTMRGLVENYHNIRIRKLHFDGFFAGTPLERWYFCSDWNYGSFAVSHLSDAFRFLILFKYGGYYFDLDIVHLKPIKVQYRNFVAVESLKGEVILGSAVIHAEYQHLFTLIAVEEFQNNYKY